MPGDDLLPDADVLATRAMTIDAPPDAIWPWLVEMGSGRGGAYTYDWIENLLGLDMHSADEVLSQFQGLCVGDVLPMGANRPGMRIEVLDRDRAMVSRRNRIGMPGASRLARAFNVLVMEPGSLVMERRMLLGIKERAERQAV
jgi:hypothetical protein